VQTGPQYWFRAKRYGWGWGLPISWQGWAVLIAFIGVVGAGAFLFPPRKVLAVYLLYVAVLSVALIAIYWLKGEPPCWRWGED
jgi:hypothetical protein